MIKKDTYCRLPFKEIAIKDYYDGKLMAFAPCCMMSNMSTAGPNLLKVKDPHLLTPQEMFDHPRTQLLRDNLLNGIQDEACAICWHQENSGLKSHREYHPRPVDTDDSDGLSVIDITVSNVCNLRCRMCSPSSSHQLMKDHQFFKENGYASTANQLTGRWFPSKPVKLTESVQWEWFLKNSDKIKVIKASGGEPFYDSKFVELLNKYIETGDAKNTSLKFHTNAILFDDSLIEILNQFKENRHVFSVDGVGKTYEYIRYPATFLELENSIKLYLNKVTNYYPILQFTFVLSAYNILNIDDFATWVKQISPAAIMKFSEVYPLNRGISINHLPKHILETAKNQASKHLIRNNLEDDNFKNLIIQIDNAIKNNKENKNKLKGEFVLFDMSRNQSYRDFLHEDLVSWLDS